MPQKWEPDLPLGIPLLKGRLDMCEPQQYQVEWLLSMHDERRLCIPGAGEQRQRVSSSCSHTSHNSDHGTVISIKKQYREASSIVSDSVSYVAYCIV